MDEIILTIKATDTSDKVYLREALATGEDGDGTPVEVSEANCLILRYGKVQLSIDYMDLINAVKQYALREKGE